MKDIVKGVLAIIGSLIALVIMAVLIVPIGIIIVPLILIILFVGLAICCIKLMVIFNSKEVKSAFLEAIEEAKKEPEGKGCDTVS